MGGAPSSYHINTLFVPLLDRVFRCVNSSITGFGAEGRLPNNIMDVSYVYIRSRVVRINVLCIITVTSYVVNSVSKSLLSSESKTFGFLVS